MGEQQEWLSDFAYDTLVNIGKAGTMFSRQELAQKMAWGLPNPDHVIGELVHGRYIVHSARSADFYVLVSNPVTTRVAGSALLRRAPKTNPWVSVPPDAPEQTPHKEQSAMDKTIEQISRETYKKYSGPGNAHKMMGKGFMTGEELHQSCVEQPQPGMFRGYSEVITAIFLCSLAAALMCALIVGVGWGLIEGVRWLLNSTDILAFIIGSLLFLGAGFSIGHAKKLIDEDIDRR